MPSPQPPKEKRGVISARRRRQLLLLVTDYTRLQRKYPELSQDIQEDINAHVRQAERTREADRRDVLQALEEWRDTGLTAEEICDDTGLSDRTVRGVLEELQQAPSVSYRENAVDRERGRPVRIFFPVASENK